MYKYVDDTKYYGVVNNEDDVLEYQDNLNSLYSWANDNDMVWNALKFQLLRMGQDDALKNDTIIFSPEYGEVINESDFVKDLGVLVDSNLQYREQRNKAINKANQKAGWVLRTFKDRSIDHMRRMWRTLIQPHQDYGCGLLIYLMETKEVCNHKKVHCAPLQNVRTVCMTQTIGADYRSSNYYPFRGV